MRNCLRAREGMASLSPSTLQVGRTSPVEAFAASQLQKSPGCPVVETAPREYDYFYHKSSLPYPNSGSKSPQTRGVALIS